MVQTAGQGDSCTTPTSAHNAPAGWAHAVDPGGALRVLIMTWWGVRTGLAPGMRMRVVNEADFAHW